MTVFEHMYDPLRANVSEVQRKQVLFDVIACLGALHFFFFYLNFFSFREPLAPLLLGSALAAFCHPLCLVCLLFAVC